MLLRKGLLTPERIKGKKYLKAALLFPLVSYRYQRDTTTVSGRAGGAFRTQKVCA